MMEAQPEEYVAPVQPADSYNGARHENFTWSQSISDLDVLVNVPSCLTNPGDVRVVVSAKGIKVEGRKNSQQSEDRAYKILEQKDNDFKVPTSSEKWEIIFEGEFSFPTKKEETLWSLEPGKYINVHLEKAKERWWEALIVGEEKIDLSKIDCSKDLFELGETEQMKVGELMWNHQQKLLKENKVSGLLDSDK